jgi:hypothetical protein
VIMYEIERPNKNLSQVEISYLVGTSDLNPFIIFQECLSTLKTPIMNITNKTLFKKNSPITVLPFVS